MDSVLTFNFSCYSRAETTEDFQYAQYQYDFIWLMKLHRIFTMLFLTSRCLRLSEFYQVELVYGMQAILY